MKLKIVYRVSEPRKDQIGKKDEVWHCASLFGWKNNILITIFSGKIISKHSLNYFSLRLPVGTYLLLEHKDSDKMRPHASK